MKTASIDQEGASEVPFSNFKTAHDTSTKITKNDVLIIFIILAKRDLHNDVSRRFIITFYC